MRINHNMQAINTHRQLGISQSAGAKSMEKLSSGFRINRAADDAAGLSISEKMRGQIRGLTQASRNAQDGISVVQTAEGALDEVHAMLQRMRELAVQSASDSNTTGDREYIQAEVDQLSKEIGQVATRTEFNTMKLLSGGFTGKHFHVGANKDQTIEVSIDGLTEAALGFNPASGGLDFTTRAGANTGIKTVDDAIVNIAKQRSNLGAIQNRMEHTIKNLDNAAENTQAAEARIRDVDMAKEMMEQTRQNILQQASTAMLAQANQAPQTVLQLLR